MTTNWTGPVTSLQKVLGGKYDVEWLVDKANQDLIRSMTSLTAFYHAAMDFAIDISSLSDWVFHHHAKNNPAWASMKPQDGVKAFAKYAAEQNKAVATFMDLANEFKHADRTKPSPHVGNLFAYWTQDPVNFEEDTSWLENALATRFSSGKVLIPAVELSDGSGWAFRPFAQQALDWWISFDAMAPIA